MEKESERSLPQSAAPTAPSSEGAGERATEGGSCDLYSPSAAPTALPEGEERAAEGVGPYNGGAGEAGATEGVGSCDGDAAREEAGTGFVQQKCPGGCIYRGKVSGTSCCNYIFITGKSRGCPPGRDCTRYRRGVRLLCPEE